MMKNSVFNYTENLIMLHNIYHNIDQPAHKTQAKKQGGKIGFWLFVKTIFDEVVGTFEI